DRADVVRRVTDPHLPPAEDVRGTDQDRIADPLGDGAGLLRITRDPPLRAANAEPVEQCREPLPVLGEVDGVERRAEDREAGSLEPSRQLERRLTAELNGDAVWTLALADSEHLLQPQWLEVEAVGCVVVGRHRL